MSDMSAGEKRSLEHGHEILHLLPQDMLTKECYNVRPWSGKTERDIGEENRRIERLAASIERDGQIDDAIVQFSISKGEDGEERPVLFIGHRRRRAVALINEKRAINGEGLLRLRCKVDRTGGDYRRRAIVSNEERAGLSAMDRALLIKQLREEYHWEGYPGAKKVAAYMGINVATVTQHERFLGPDVSPELQEKLHEGVLSAQSALEILGAGMKGQEQGRVVRRAAEIQHEDAVERETDRVGRGRRDPAKAAQAIGKAGAAARGVKGARVEHPAVRKALREAQSGGTAAIHRNRAAILEWFEGQDGPGNGDTEGAVRVFVRYLVDKWAIGEGTDRTLQEKWDAMIVVEVQTPKVKTLPKPSSPAAAMSKKNKKKKRPSPKPKPKK